MFDPDRLAVALKEWAVVCQALADGTQTLLLRKGGIAEAGGEFVPDHARFWLYPTWLHQAEQRDGIKPEYRPHLDRLLPTAPAPGTVTFTHLARVVSVYRLHRIETALALDPLHVLTDDVIRQRFHYKKPGLWAMLLRVERVGIPLTVAVTPAYEGCKSWVELDSALSVSAAEPVIEDRAFADRQEVIDRVLNPELLA